MSKDERCVPKSCTHGKQDLLHIWMGQFTCCYAFLYWFNPWQLYLAYVIELDSGQCLFKWDVNYFAWKDFSNAIITHEGQIWEKCISADLVCGGLDFSLDFMWVFSRNAFHLFKIPRDPWFNYGLSHQEIRSYWEGMCALSEHTKIWPMPPDSLRHGNKLTYLKSLEEIAEGVLNWYKVS